MKRYPQSLFILLLSAIGTVCDQAQTLSPRVVPRSFDVASIRPDRTGSESRRAGTSPGGMFTATNVRLKLLIARAFGVAEFQVAGGPSWLEAETYDIAARADTPLQMSTEEVRPCLQALLAEISPRDETGIRVFPGGGQEDPEAERAPRRG